MSTVTKIEWADLTWSPILGCQRVSAGCDHCYAIRTVHRLSHNPNPKIGPLYQGLTSREEEGLDWTGAITTVPDRLTEPFTWKRPRRIFVNSQSDLFHPAIPVEFIAEVFAVMAATPRHTYQLLTKRHGRMRSLLNDPAFYRLVRVTGHRAKWGWPDGVEFQGPPWPLPNLWLGVSVETQQWTHRITALMDTPASVRWVSAEPMLGPLDMHRWLPGVADPALDWVVVGTESGPGARPVDLTDVGVLVAQLLDAGVPTLVKQLPTGPRGRATQDITTFPEHLRVREYPTTTTEGTTR